MSFQQQIEQNTREYQDFVDSLKSWERSKKPPRPSKDVDKENEVDFPEPKKAGPKIKGFDYSAWDKFDVDGALQDIDQSEEFRLRQNAKQALTEKENGNEHFKAGRYENALESYSKAIELDPRVPVYFVNRAYCLIKLARFKEALADCDKCLHLDPKNAKAYWRRSIAQRNLGDIASAVSNLEMCVKFEPHNASIVADLETLKLALPSRSRRLTVEEIGRPPQAQPTVEPVEIVKLTTNSFKVLGTETEVEPIKRTTKKVLETETKVETPLPPPTLKVEPKQEATLTTSLFETIPRAPLYSAEFVRDWRTLKTTSARYAYLKQISPDTFPGLFKSSLEPSHLSDMFQVVAEQSDDESAYIEHFLAMLVKTERFDMNLMFVSAALKQKLRTFIVDALGNPPTLESFLKKL